MTAVKRKETPNGPTRRRHGVFHVAPLKITTAVIAAATLQPSIRSQYFQFFRTRLTCPHPPHLPYLWQPTQLRPFALGIVPVSMNWVALGAWPDEGASLIKR